MNSLHPLSPAHRFTLRKTLHLSERIDKSPSITECHKASEHLQISYAPGGASVLPFIQQAFQRAHTFAKEWFSLQRNIPIDLWTAPTLEDLQYMTCIPCEEDSFFAPGMRGGMGVILFVSPLSCRANTDEERLSGCLAHEITHHIVRDISGATSHTMRRREKSDVPMWLEEGLCQLVQAGVDAAFRSRMDEAAARTTERLDPGDLWNDLSSHPNMGRAYLQAYKEARGLTAKMGKMGLARLLGVSREHAVDWSALGS